MNTVLTFINLGLALLTIKSYSTKQIFGSTFVSLLPNQIFTVFATQHY